MSTTNPTAADDLACELEALRTITTSLLMLTKVEGMRLADARPMLEKLDTLAFIAKLHAEACTAMNDE